MAQRDFPRRLISTDLKNSRVVDFSRIDGTQFLSIAPVLPRSLPSGEQWKHAEFGKVKVVVKDDPDEPARESEFPILPEGVMPRHYTTSKIVPVSGLVSDTSFYVYAMQTQHRALLGHDVATAGFCDVNICKLILPANKLAFVSDDTNWSAAVTGAKADMQTKLGRTHPQLRALMGVKLATALSGAVSPRRTAQRPLNIDYWPTYCFMDDP